MTSAFCLFVFETFVSRLLALFGTIMTSESGNPTPPGDKWERKLLVFGIFYSFLTSGRPLSSSTGNESTFASQNLDVARNVQSDERQLYSQVTSSLTVSHKNNFKDTQELKVTSQVKRTPQDSINPLSPNIHKQILQTHLYTFPYRISWEKLIKDQRFFSL